MRGWVAASLASATVPALAHGRWTWPPGLARRRALACSRVVWVGAACASAYGRQ